MFQFKTSKIVWNTLYYLNIEFANFKKFIKYNCIFFIIICVCQVK